MSARPDPTAVGGAAGGSQLSTDRPKNYHSPALDARSELEVQNTDALSHIMEQASRRIGDTDLRLGDQPLCISVPALLKDTGSSKNEPQLKMMRKAADEHRFALSNLPFVDGLDECITSLHTGQ